MGAVQDFIRGLRIIFKGREGDTNQGDKGLARMSRIVEAQIPVYGVRTVRAEVVKGLEKDMFRFARKGGREEVERRIDLAKSTPDYMRLLHKLGMEEAHLWAAGHQAMKTIKNKAVVNEKR